MKRQMIRMFRGNEEVTVHGRSVKHTDRETVMRPFQMSGNTAVPSLYIERYRFVTDVREIP
jgi:hypothetical protein